jgi:lysophospholipase L1-like esterase
MPVLGATSVAAADNSVIGAYNVTEDTIRRFRAALAKAVAGVADCNILFVGDSTCAGGTDRTVQIGRQFRDLLNSRGYKIKGTGFVPYIPSPIDPRMVGGGGLTLTPTTGNSAPAMALTPGQSVTFTPTTGVNNTGLGKADPQHDTFVFHYHQNATGGTVSYSVDGGTATTVSTTGSNALIPVTVAAGSVGAHSLTISNSGGSGNVTLGMAGVNAYNSTVKGAQVHVFSQSGALSQLFTGTSLFGAMADAFTATTPALAVDLFGINDANTNNAVATYQTNKQTYRTFAAAQGADILGVVPLPANITPTAGLSAYWAVDYAMADAMNHGLLDVNKRWKDWATSNSLGTQFDTLHPTPTGYADIAHALVQTLRL